MSDIKPAVVAAIDEVRSSFPGRQIDIESDGQGGAFVRLHEVDLGPTYQPQKTWIGFQITFQYPFADVYPHFIRPDIRRADGKPFGEAIHPDKTFPRPSGSENAILISRASRHRDPATDTAVVKLAKVLDWIRSR
jgi:hypothetical protein